MVTQTRKLTEGAMMVALVGLMLFVNLQLGGMPEALMYWILTFPILIYTAKYGIRNGLIAAFSTTLLSFMISSPTTIFYLFSCNVCGLFYGEGIRKKWKNGVLYMGTAVFTFLSYLVTTFFLASLFGYDPKEDIEMISQLLSLFHIGQDLDLAKLTGMIILVSTILLSAMQALCIHLFAHVLLMRLHIETRKIKTIFEIHLPSYAGLLIFFIWVLYFMRNVIKLNQEVLGILLIWDSESYCHFLWGNFSVLCTAFIKTEEICISCFAGSICTVCADGHWLYWYFGYVYRFKRYLFANMETRCHSWIVWRILKYKLHLLFLRKSLRFWHCL